MIYRFLFWGAFASISILAVLPDYNALPSVVSINDLINHAVAFATLTFLYAHGYKHTYKRIIGSLLIYGSAIEVIQMGLPTRFASIEDLLADFVGIMIGWIVVQSLKYIRSLRITPKG